MCTLSWKPLDGGYLLYFNRDELRSRAPAQPPRVWSRDGMTFIAPRDPEGGGTWLLLNAAGLCLGLLNHYSKTLSASDRATHSRGELALRCADCASIDAAVARVGDFALERYAPFHLVIAGPEASGRLTWDGFRLEHTPLDPGGAMLTTSSFSPSTVIPARRAIFARIASDMRTATPDRLRAFHNYSATDGAQGIRVSRPDACTHSIAQVRVSWRRLQASLDYWPSIEVQPRAQSTHCRLELERRHAA